jgi:hypothetical protein
MSDAEVDRATQQLDAACKTVDRDIPPAIERLKAATTAFVNSALDVARLGRSTSHSGTMRAVIPPKPGEPPPVGDLTNKFQALKG